MLMMNQIGKEDQEDMQYRLWVICLLKKLMGNYK